MTAGASSDSGSATDGVLSRLVGELEELGFEPTRPVGCPDETVYTATDSAVVVTVITNESTPHVCVSASRGPDAAWTMHWTATAPVSVQLIALYAAVNENPAAALTAAAAALGAPPPVSPERPSPTAG